MCLISKRLFTHGRRRFVILLRCGTGAVIKERKLVASVTRIVILQWVTCLFDRSSITIVLLTLIKRGKTMIEKDTARKDSRWD